MGIDYELIRSARKSIGAEIRQGRLIVRVPFSASQSDILRFLTQHRRWIETHLAKASELQSMPRMTREEIKALAEKARETIPGRVAYFAPLAGVTYGRVTIRTQRSRWGSCSAKGNLSFNCLLMLAPPEVLDSVIVHELCHRTEMNHSGRFYDIVLRVMPDYYKNHQWLKDNGAKLMAMLGPKNN